MFPYFSVNHISYCCTSKSYFLGDGTMRQTQFSQTKNLLMKIFVHLNVHSSSDIFSMRHWFQMTRADTSRNTAKMIKLQTFWHWPMRLYPHCDMCPGLFVSNGHFPISRRAASTMRPNPTRRLISTIDNYVILLYNNSMRRIVTVLESSRSDDGFTTTTFTRNQNSTSRNPIECGPVIPDKSLRLTFNSSLSSICSFRKWCWLTASTFTQFLSIHDHQEYTIDGLHYARTVGQ